jgi:CTP:molybdopterin cytidylyltransferase MocA
MRGDHLTAIILAAGYSSRMGRFKPLLPLGETTVVERAIDLFRENRIPDIRVVVGHDRERLTPVLRSYPVSIVMNPDYPEGMFSSVLTAVRSLRPTTTAFFLLPVDVPLVRSFTVKRLLEAYEASPERILMPAFKGRPGHPPLIPASLAGAIMGADGTNGTDGLRGVLASHAHLIRMVEVPDNHMRFDLDTPKDYAGLLARLARYDIPTLREIEVILEHIHPVPEKILKHSRKVAEISDRLARALGRSGVPLNRRRLRAAALLHDMARGEKQHGAVAARWLEEMGFSCLCGMVASHMDLQPDETNETKGISEAEVLFISDKLVLEDQPVRLRHRYEAAMKRYAGAPGSATNIALRLERALRIKARMERILGTTLEDLLAI